MSSYSQFLLARMSGIGGSDVAGIMELSPWASPMSVFRDKMIVPEPDLPDPPWMEWGRRLEPVIATWYVDFNDRERSLTTCRELLRSDTCPWMHANIDMWVDCPEKGRGVCEIKNVSAFTASDWKNGPPLHYQLQVQHYLHVTGCTWGVFVIFLGNDCRWVDVERDDKLIETIIEVTREFWQQVQDDRPPLADGHKATRESILALYPQDDETDAIALGDDATEWDAEIAEANEIIKGQEAIVDDRKNKLRQAIGKHTLGVLPGEAGAWSYKQGKKSRTLRRKGS